jgi:Bifunctional DNA primase/polymerase, N-terminal
VSRPRWQLRDAALGYASRAIPVLPVHYPLPHHSDLQPLTDGRRMVPSPPSPSCSCRDPGCGQPAKHPLGSLVPHGVKDATTNRARVLAWWTRHPRPTSAWQPGTCSTCSMSTAPKASTRSGSWRPSMAC